MGKVVSGVTRGLGLTADPNAGAELAAASQAQIQQAIEEIDRLQIPDIEKQKLKLNLMSEAGFLDAEQLQQEEEIRLDPSLRQAQMEALSQLRERGETGLTEEDKAVQDIMLRDVSAQEQASRQGVMQDMAQRGMLDSGAQLASQLGGQQNTYNRAANQASQNAIAAAAARRDALAQSANLASGMQNQDFSRGSQERDYRQSIDRFNTQNRQDIAKQNLGIRQQDIGLQNQEQMYNKGLLQQQFENQRGLSQMKSNARMGQASNTMQQSQAQAQAAQAEAAGVRDIVIGGAQAATMGKADGGLVYRDGGIACSTKRAEDGSLMYESDDDIVGGDSYAGDRVDAKLNSGEVVLNAPQQQRLMDVIRGEEDLTALGDEDIIEGVPESYRNKLHGKQDKKQQMAKGFQRLIEMLGK